MVRKLIICFLAVLLPLALSAQDHLDFLGIPLDGPLKTFVKPLRKAGFKYKDKSRDDHWFTGKYYGDPAELFVATTAASGTVYLVMVNYPPKTDWPSLRNQYEYIRMRLTALYGEPTNKREVFDFPYTEEDGLRALEYGKCSRISSGALPEGVVSVSLTEDFRVRVFFTDKSGLSLASQEKQ